MQGQRKYEIPEPHFQIHLPAVVMATHETFSGEFNDLSETNLCDEEKSIMHTLPTLARSLIS